MTKIELIKALAGVSNNARIYCQPTTDEQYYRIGLRDPVISKFPKVDDKSPEFVCIDAQLPKGEMS